MSNNERIGKLILEDGSIFEGFSFGEEKNVSGEVVFNTGMVGYPETLTDPSYRGQILVLTYPLIGNYGVPGDEREDGLLKYFESEEIQVKGLVISDLSFDYSHWSARRSLMDWFKYSKIPGLYGIDTRMLTKRLREKGTMLGKIVFNNEDIEFDNPNERNLVSEVSVKEVIEYKRSRKRIGLVDCGVKNNIIRAFLKRDISVIRYPWDFDFTKDKIDGVLISNGPGDPKKCEATIENVRKAISKNIPILGICLGSQILGLAAGANTYKLKYGHRGQNQPCVEVGTRRCYITSQNHGYAVDAKTLPEDWREWFYNNNDQTNEGIIHLSKPFFGSQFHPEASPGPDDTEFIFDLFVRAL
ncbi:MAG: glutamine-hydrolyzing carbamoyl-phosphate synthase small subunit [candidate division WOR-3 bacterium]